MLHNGVIWANRTGEPRWSTQSGPKSRGVVTDPLCSVLQFCERDVTYRESILHLSSVTEPMIVPNSIEFISDSLAQVLNPKSDSVKLVLVDFKLAEGPANDSSLFHRSIAHNGNGTLCAALYSHLFL